jgi:glycosyltransferase involved in cell wall biosynthesis
MKKVLMIGPDRSVHGGISGVVNNYYGAGLDTKVDLCYIGTMSEGSRVHKLCKAGSAYIKFLRRLPACDIVHVNMASDNSYRRKAVFIRTAHFFHKKIVIHQHGGDFETFYHKELTEKGRRKVQQVCSMADAFLVLAPVWRDFFGQIIDKERITVLPDSIAIPESSPKSYDNHNILFLGRLCREKGIGELLGCMPGLAEAVPDVHLYLGGIWEDRELQALAESDPEHVTWLGWVEKEEKEKWLAQSRILALPSYFEGQSVSLLEAMAYRCAIAASDTGGIPQMILHEETGLLVPPKDMQALESALLRLLQDETLCEQLGSAAYSKVKEEFDIEENMRRLIAIYESL